jgi:two-component system, sensor histidine kinase and response regulator
MTKILVIEDEFDIRDEVMNWLQFEGYEVVGAANGKIGLDAIYTEQPDLVICDINMPDMDGHQVLIELRSDVTFAQLPFVFLTAATDRTSMRKGMNLGADDYLTKPFSHADIIDTVSARLSKVQQIQSQIDRLSNAIDVLQEQRLLKSQLVGMFSHDFRNPLASIRSSSSILQSYSDRMTPEQQRTHFGRIDGAVHLLLQMLDEMLMVAEIENGQITLHPQVIHLSRMIERLIDDFRLIDSEQHQLVFSSNLPETVEIDPKLVQHIITNLISNAIKYSPEGSVISIEAYIAEERIVTSVQDAGIGVAESDLSYVFEPFFRAENARHIKGNGLGLALAKRASDACGGTIEVTSTPGVGSCFTLRLPIT